MCIPISLCLTVLHTYSTPRNKCISQAIHILWKWNDEIKSWIEFALRYAAESVKKLDNRTFRQDENTNEKREVQIYIIEFHSFALVLCPFCNWPRYPLLTTTPSCRVHRALTPANTLGMLWAFTSLIITIGRLATFFAKYVSSTIQNSPTKHPFSEIKLYIKYMSIIVAFNSTDYSSLTVRIPGNTWSLNTRVGFGPSNSDLLSCWYASTMGAVLVIKPFRLRDYNFLLYYPRRPRRIPVWLGRHRMCLGAPAAGTIDEFREKITLGIFRAWHSPL